MKKKIALLLATFTMVSCLSVCNAEACDKAETVVPTIHDAAVKSGSVTVYDFGASKLHVCNTGDALGDVAYIVEGMNVYGTQGAQDSIASGSTYATTQGLYETFGDDFHGGADLANINKVVSGTVTVAGIDFNLIDCGETYDLEIPSMNAVYTHMLGKTCHSILTSTAHMDSMIETLKGYQSAGYDMILSAHSGVEGQDAVAEKIAYVEKAKELAASCENAEAFMTAMKEAFPDYIGENYLEMSAGYLYQ